MAPRAMDLNDYGLEQLARERLEAARAFAARRALVARARGRESRARLGVFLMQRVRRLLGKAALR